MTASRRPCASHRLPPDFGRLPPGARAQIPGGGRGCDRGDRMRVAPCRLARHRCGKTRRGRRFRRRHARSRGLPARLAQRRARDPAQCLICPVLDFEETSPSREAFAENHLLDRPTLEADLADYLPDGADPADPRISPLRATRFAGLPPPLSIPPSSIRCAMKATPTPASFWRRASTSNTSAMTA